MSQEDEVGLSQRQWPCKAVDARISRPQSGLDDGLRDRWVVEGANGLMAMIKATTAIFRDEREQRFPRAVLVDDDPRIS